MRPLVRSIRDRSHPLSSGRSLFAGYLAHPPTTTSGTRRGGRFAGPPVLHSDHEAANYRPAGIGDPIRLFASQVCIWIQNVRLIAIALACAFSAVVGFSLASVSQVRMLESHIAVLHAILAVPEPSGAVVDLTSGQSDD